MKTKFTTWWNTLKKHSSIDEAPEYHKRRVWPFVVVNVLCAVVVGASLFVLASLASQGFSPWNTNPEYGNAADRQLVGEAKKHVRYMLASQRQSEWKELPADAPVPLAFGSWSDMDRLRYMTLLQEKNTAEEKLTFAKTYVKERTHGDGNATLQGEGTGEAVPLLYKKADILDWAQKGLKTVNTSVRLRTGDHTDFVKESDARGQKLEEDGGEWHQSDIETVMEVKQPLGATSLEKAANGNLELYRSYMEQLQITFDSFSGMALPLENPSQQATNLQVTLSLFNGAKTFTNAKRVKDKTPVWSAPIVLKEKQCRVGEGLWKDKLSHARVPFLTMLEDQDLRWSNDVELTVRVDTTLQEEDALQIFTQTQPKVEKLWSTLLIAGGIALLLWLVTLGLSLARTTNADMPLVRKVEGFIPLELVLLAGGIFAVLVGSMCLETLKGAQHHAEQFLTNPWSDPLWLLLIPALAIVDITGWYLLSLLFRKARQGRFFRGSVLGGLLHFVRERYRDYRDGKDADHRFLLRLVVFYAIVGGLLFLVVLSHSSFLWMAFLLFVIGAPIMFALEQDRSDARILRTMQNIVQGDPHGKLEEEEFRGAHKVMAEQINHFDESLQNAVQKSLKNERMQTELITNVSHDLRTPLTSIINYVDLLRNPDITEKEQKEYLDVLAKKSARLKTLMNDLIDVSKATSGAMKLHMEAINYSEVIRQSLAEMETGWENNGLQPVVTLPEEELSVYADGQKLSRVLENLFSNAQKYGQSGTRVYIEAEKDGQEAVFTIKNTSRYPLNMTAEELLERFNRSDKSRTTEGSGLGLSIADQLTRRMGGRLRLTIDGDLFTAKVCFPLQH